MAPDDPALYADRDDAPPEPEASVERQAEWLRVLDLHPSRGEVQDRDGRRAEAAGKRFHRAESMRPAEVTYIGDDIGHGVGKGTLPILRLLDVSADLLPDELRDWRRCELPFLDADEDVLRLRDDPLRRGLPPHLEVHVE